MACVMIEILLLFFYICGIHGDSLRYHYVYVDNVKGWMKLYKTPANYTDAKSTCEHDGAVLAIPSATEMTNAMISLMKYESNISKVQTDLDIMRENSKWVMNKLGTFQLRNKNKKFPYICYSRDEEPTCGKEYQLQKLTGRCYKIHTIQRTWKIARRTCILEGGDLAVPRNDTEAVFIKHIFWLYPPASIPGDEWKDSAFLGIYAKKMESGRIWITVKGTTLDKSGNSSWAPNEPNNDNGDEYCVTIGRNGLLYDDPCYRKLPYICEKKAKDVPKHGLL